MGVLFNISFLFLSFLIVCLFNKSNIMGTDNSICLLKKLIGGLGGWKTRFWTRDGLCGVLFCQEVVYSWCEVWHFDYRAAEELSCVEVEVEVELVVLVELSTRNVMRGGSISVAGISPYYSTME